MYVSAYETYNSFMATVKISEARGNFADVVRKAQTEAVVLGRRGTGQAVVVSVQQYERMMEALEEVEDAAAFDASMAEDGDNLPWDEVRKELGW